MISDSVKNLGFAQLFVTVVFFVRQYFMAGLIIYGDPLGLVTVILPYDPNIYIVTTPDFMDIYVC